MQLIEISTDEPLLFSMLRKLSSVGHPIAINAHTKPFTVTGRDGSKSMRLLRRGWVINHVGRLNNSLRQGVVFWTTFDDYPVNHEYRFSGTFTFDPSVDEHYTLKKVNGVWTLLDAVKRATPEVKEK